MSKSYCRLPATQSVVQDRAKYESTFGLYLGRVKGRGIPLNKLVRGPTVNTAGTAIYNGRVIGRGQVLQTQSHKNKINPNPCKVGILTGRSPCH